MDLPRPPDDMEVKNIIDKLALFVARNGPEFEQMTKNKQEGNPKFSFLYGGENYHYYTYKVTIEQQLLRTKGPGYDGPGSSQGSGGGSWGGGGGGGHSTWSHGQSTPPRPLMSGAWGGGGNHGNHGGNGHGGSPWSSPGLGRGLGHGGHRPNSPHFGGGGGYPGPGGSADIPNRGRSLLGAPPPLMDQPPARPPPQSHAPTPPPAPVAPGPNVSHLELQAGELQKTIKTLQVGNYNNGLLS